MLMLVMSLVVFLAGASPKESLARSPYSHWSIVSTWTDFMLISLTISSSCQLEAPAGCSRMKYPPTFIWMRHVLIATLSNSIPFSFSC